MFTVVDLSKRLPGPYACKRLLSLGATVLRFEDLDSPDPFSVNEMRQLNPLFFEWYTNINRGKICEEFSFQKNKAKLKDLILKLPSNSIIIHSLGDKKEKEIFKELITDDIVTSKQFIIISIKASKENPHLHDLNALALHGLLDYHATHFKDQTTIAPPFLPIAGISFGHAIAEKALATWIKKEYGYHSIYLTEEIRESLGLLKGSVDRALHNGLFPSYQIYKTRDQKYVAVALVEEKFWREFLAITKIPLSIAERFSIDKVAFQKLESYFLTKDSEELKVLFQNLSSLTVFS